MWAHPATQENVTVLQSRGWKMVAPEAGQQACGEVGEGRLAEPETLFAHMVSHFHAQNYPQDVPRSIWTNKTILITAGPTLEDIDPVRFIGNRSSGKMGFALAEQATKLGAKVILISGPVSLSTPKDVERINVRSALEMFQQVKQHYAQVDVLIAAAAVADYRIAQPSDHKIKKQTDQDTLQLELVKNPDIVAWVAQQADKPFVVGFAAETENLIPYAQSKLATKNLDMICANQVGQGIGFDSEDNRLILITPTHIHPLEPSSKTEQARQVLDLVEKTISKNTM
jgi:phosphopantothenoylcysteine decarboxylase/phosphopantothenate--cysteine ligase